MTKFNKLLLSSSALVGAAFLANTANAGTIMVKDDLEIKMNGFVAFQAGIYDGDTKHGTNTTKDFDNGHDFRTKLELEFDGRNKADNGLEYGFQIRLQNFKEDGFEDTDLLKVKEAKVWMAGDWGHLDFGDDHGPIQKMDYRAPTVGMGQIDGDYDAYTGPLGTGQIGLHALNSERSTKIAYYTPRFNFFGDAEDNGIQLGVSYAPEFQSRGRNVTRTDFTTGIDGDLQLGLAGNQQQWFEVGVNAIQDFGPVQARLFGGYSHADAKKNSAAAGTALEDVRSWQVGGQLAYAGFTFGGAYVDANDSGQLKTDKKNDKDAWNVGLTYENGPWGIGVSYLDEDLGKAGNIVAGGDFQLISVGVNYVLAPGLSLAADVSHFDRDFKEVGRASPDGNEVLGTKKKNDGWVAILQTRVDF